MHKCERCSKEFCSTINYRRHIRVHRRSLNIDVDSPKNRDVLGAFWDKLLLDDATDIVSFKNVMLEDVPGSSIIRALTSLVRKPGFSLLPQVYIKAGAALLDVVQCRPSRFPISSQELFSILDDASEKTFLCAGTAISMQKFVFDGEAAKIGLEMKNLVACTSFLVEQKLVTAWLADKDAEALRCHKLLVEEEEAARRRQAELLERRRLKKLRQKEQKSREQTEGDKEDSRDGSPDALYDVVSPTEKKTIPEAAPNLHSQEGQLGPVSSFLEPVGHLRYDVEADTGCQTWFSGPDVEITSHNRSSDNYQTADPQMQQRGGWWQPIVAQRQFSKPQRGMPIGLHSAQNALKLGAVQKHGTYREQRTASMANGQKVWTRKTKPEVGEDLRSRIRRELVDQSDNNDNCELLIGSISVTLGDCSTMCQVDTTVAALDQCMTEYVPPRRNHIVEKPIKPDSGQGGTNQQMAKLWRLVGRHELGDSMHFQGDKREDEVSVTSGLFTNQNPSNESYLAHCSMDDDSSGSIRDSPMLLEGNASSRRPKLFSRRAAEAFLVQRWQEVIAADHVKLVLCSENEPPDFMDSHENVLTPSQFSSDGCKRNILGNAENWLVGVGPFEPITTGAAKTKCKGKQENGYRLKYIPKKRNCT
ncbi:uncharacterized protein LOC122081932 isoform X2 [Macadamia integrifolia]|nr:uncharacterized protein LOC122081932 isoform X2 [Macadamia integrifolia]